MTTFGSVCSGIEAASVAFQPIGWRAAWFSEIEPFACAVLKHHYPDVPNLGDMTTLPQKILSRSVEAPDVFCGGTPCQAFSVAGQRRSLEDDRGNLSLVFCEIADEIDVVRRDQGRRPSVILWENVPGVLSTKDNAFGCFLGELAGESAPLKSPRGTWPHAGVVVGPKRSIAWRILDAQYFGLAQRRKRVFVVASARDDIDTAAILFEFEGGQRNNPPSRSQTTNPSSEFSFSVAGNIIGRKPHNGGNGAGISHEIMYTITRGDRHAIMQHVETTATTFNAQGSRQFFNEQIAGTLVRCNKAAVQTGSILRFMTPREYERLMGFPDDYTMVPYRGLPANRCAVSPRYAALGNSWAVPVVAWIGQRIERIMQ